MTLAITWALALAWLVFIPVVVVDAVEWQMRPDSLRERQMRSVWLLLLAGLLGLAAAWSISLPYV
jgi:Na+/proline symporter